MHPTITLAFLLILVGMVHSTYLPEIRAPMAYEPPAYGSDEPPVYGSDEPPVYGSDEPPVYGPDEPSVYGSPPA
jgi:hypothetical protein